MVYYSKLKLNYIPQKLILSLLQTRNVSQNRLLVGTPVCVQFALLLSQGLYLVFQSPGEEKRDWSKEQCCRCGGKEECLLSVGKGGRSVLKIHFFIESGLKIQNKIPVIH